MNLPSRVYATLSEVVANLGRMEQRRPRIRLHSLPDGAVFVVRGDELDPATIREDAANFRERFADWGRYGCQHFSPWMMARSTCSVRHASYDSRLLRSSVGFAARNRYRNRPDLSDPARDLVPPNARRIGDEPEGLRARRTIEPIS